ncbi:hypothetical protein GS424_007435 [Eggerthella guodeyinii]|uniref:Uncharacterized protein n=1 Tax=Eggerthella guodeyinii TaxID=2690837 RepID=A0A6L7IRC0_9ACTN|nr:hypothetical protein [Eggerthella guodeyinii]QOS69659.1 hypothetical protein GS424_007435 [Eggerthella guodeyinii]
MSDKTHADEPANKDIAEKKAEPDLTFEEKVERLVRFMQFEPLIRELDYQILVSCAERVGLSELEERIASWPAFKAATRDQFALITELANHHGLELFELDEAGNPVLEADKAGLTENEVDDLVAGFAYRITAVGKEAAERLDPERRFRALLDDAPARRDAYLSIVGFLRDKHSFADVDAFLRGQAVVGLSREAGDGGVQPSVFVDKLERAGALFYDGGWQATEAGLKVAADATSAARA